MRHENICCLIVDEQTFSQVVADINNVQVISVPLTEEFHLPVDEVYIYLYEVYIYLYEVYIFMQFSLNFSLHDGNQKLSLFHSQAEKVGSYLFEIFCCCYCSQFIFHFPSSGFIFIITFDCSRTNE